MLKFWQQRDVDEKSQQQLLAAFPATLSRVLAARHVRSADELDTQLTHLINPDQLRNIELAVERLLDALNAQQSILIVGDFDADGATATAVAMRGLKSLGFQQVDFLVPNRFVYGYGLTPLLVEDAKRKQPDLIITVDNGIAAIDGVAAARRHGMDVLVTDHHLPGDQLPKDCIIVNPNQKSCAFPSKNLAGVGVMFYLLLAMRKALREQDYFQEIKEPNFAELLDIVALGTVADVVPLDRNNRILVAQGVARMRAGHACAGVHALLQVAKRDYRQAVSSDLGFALGPRLNAAGRLDDMSIGIRCLITDDMDEAMALASQLDEWNQMRRDIETDMSEQATLQLKEITETHLDRLPEAVVLFDEQWHQGVIGILASRIRERVHKPVIIFAADESGELKGSARSVPGLHIRDALVRLETAHPHLLNKYGGHAMAAGMSIKANDLDDFIDALQRAVKEQRQGQSLEPILWLDGELDADSLSLPFARELEQLAPWGQGFDEPVFSGSFEVMNKRILKDKHLKVVLRGSDGLTVDAIHFNADLDAWVEPGETLECAYKLQINRYQGMESLQLMIEGIRVDESNPPLV